MKHEKKLSQAGQEQSATAEQQSRLSAECQFESVEKLLRHDALHTPVPPRIARRLRDSLAGFPAPPKAWWRRFFGS
jgi:hypothetical protein